MRYIEKGAVISKDFVYRYALWRRWGGGSAMMIIGLNPSTANGVQDDPTVRRCVGFAQREGFGALAIGNLFALRTSTPVDLECVMDPVGQENANWLYEYRNLCQVHVAAWGGHQMAWRRVSDIQDVFPNLFCFGQLRSGAPKHPLYLKKDAPLVLMETIHA